MNSKSYRWKLFVVSAIWVSFASVLVFQTAIPLSAQESPSVDGLILQLDHSSSRRRVNAAERLSLYGKNGSKAIDALIRCLGDVNKDVQIQAACTIAHVQTDCVRAIGALNQLLSDDDEHIRYAAEWSIARIARNIASEPSPETRGDLITVLQQAEKALEVVPHQLRNKNAIELALGRLFSQKQVAVEIKVESNATPNLNPTTPIKFVSDGHVLAKSSYEAIDTLGRYQFVNRLADSDAFPDSLRQIVLEVESHSIESPVLSYAIASWGERGQTSLAKLLNQLPNNRPLTEAEVRLVECLVPVNTEMLKRLSDWAIDGSLDSNVRSASIRAIAKANPPSIHSFEFIVQRLSDHDMEIRATAAEALGRMGARASTAEKALADVFINSDDDSVRFFALDAIISIAANSPTASEFVGSLLEQVPQTDPVYNNIVEACGKFGALSSAAESKLTELLESMNVDIRSSSACSLGQIGAASESASIALVERILDTHEAICVKNRSAAAIKQIGSTAVNHLISALDTDELNARENVLRALAVVGPEDVVVVERCLAWLQDANQPESLRCASAHALGAMGNSATNVAAQILIHCFAPESDLVRSAAIIAAARIHPRLARDVVQQQLDDDSIIIKASAAFAMHLVGESRVGFDRLIRLFNGSETDDIIEGILEDFGTIIDPWLLEKVDDHTADRFQRLACCKLACNGAAPDWRRLLPLAEDSDLGQEFSQCFEGYWHTRVVGDDSVEIEAVATLLSVLENQPFTPAARSRLTGLLTPDGLGAASEDEDWTGFTLSKPSALDSLVESDSIKESIKIKKGAQINSNRSAGSPLPESAPPAQLPRATAAPRKSEPVASIAPVTKNTESNNQPVLTKVFYGTNRSRNHQASSLQESAWLALTFLGACIGTLVCCFFGFVFNRNRTFVFVGVLLIAVMGTLGIYASLTMNEQDWKRSVVYGSEYRDEVEYGTCTVSIPPSHKPGILESKNVLRLEVKSDRNKHLVLTQVHPLSHDNFMAELQSAQSVKGKNLLVFIHGYNVSFEDAARRTAQMSFDLKFPGASIFYSWPSQANWYSYKMDQENVELSVTQIKKFLLDLAKKSGAKSINLVAHSMGNVGLTEALKEIDTDPEKPPFNQVVLAAPDIDADIFKNRIAPYIVTKARRLTLYASQTDLALVASRYFNNGPRVGDSCDGIPSFPGIESIDATEVDSSLLGHAYYGNSTSVLNDIGLLLDNQPIASRAYLRRIGQEPTAYWSFDSVRLSQGEAEQSNR